MSNKTTSNKTTRRSPSREQLIGAAGLAATAGLTLAMRHRKGQQAARTSKSVRKDFQRQADRELRTATEQTQVVNKVLQQELTSAQTGAASLQNENERLRSELTKVENALMDFSRKFQNTAGTIRDLEEENITLKDQVAQLREESDTLKAQVEFIVAENEQLEQTIKKLDPLFVLQQEGVSLDKGSEEDPSDVFGW